MPSRMRQWLMATVVALTSCGPARTIPDTARDAAVRDTIAAAMQQYQVAARSVHPDSIAAFYTATGVLFEPGINPIRTRDSIRAFIASFPGAKVEVATASPDTIEVLGGTALYWGSYFERLSFPGQPVSEQHGKFVAEWVRQADGAWLIQRLFRIPIPSPQPGRPQ